MQTTATTMHSKKSSAHTRKAVGTRCVVEEKNLGRGLANLATWEGGQPVKSHCCLPPRGHTHLPPTSYPPQFVLLALAPLIVLGEGQGGWGWKSF